MSDPESTTPNASEDDMQNIFQGVETRPEPSVEATQRAYANLKEDWQHQVATSGSRTKQRRWLQAVAAVAVIGIAFLFTNSSAPSQWEIQLAAGDLTVNGASFASPHAIEISANAILAASQVSRFTLQNGVELRMTADTQIRWIDAEHLYLKNGSAYINTHRQADILIETDFGKVRDIGTRFIVSADTQGIEVAVREGAAQVTTEFGTYDAVADDSTAAIVAIDRSGATQSLEAASDPRWEWIHVASAGYKANTIPKVLELVGRDLGKPVKYSTRGVQATIASVIVQGDLTDVGPRKALELVTHSAGLSWQEDGEVITINFNR